MFTLSSSAFASGGAIPTRYTCDDANVSPPLAWSGAPAAAKSFALIVDDPDAPSGLFRHWGDYDIPPGTRSLAAGQAVGKQAVNSFGKISLVPTEIASLCKGKYAADDAFRLVEFDSKKGASGDWNPVTPVKDASGGVCTKVAK